MHPLFLSILLLILSIAFKAHSVDDSVPYLTYCYGTNFTSTSPYASHLRSLLSDLVASTPNSPSFFSTINSSSLPIFGLAQCRPGISAAECDACLSNSAAAAGSNPPGGCGHQRTGSLRSSNCLLRYSEQLFFGIVEDNIVVYSDNSALQNASDSFNREVQVLMKAVMASASSAPKRFGTGIANDSVEERDIYGMGWCSMDLASSDCSECLGLLMGTMPARKTRGFIGTVSCALRFETFQFFSSSAIVTPSSAPVAAAEKRSKNKKIIIFAGPSGAVALLLLFAFFVLLLGRRKRSLAGSKIRDDVGEEMLINAEVQVFDISVIKNATNNYAIDNKLGQGGFGPVYKGVLPNGQEIAVKRLSTTSGQGLAEMTNEINFLAKLQHKNLVRLLGYCLEGEEKLLVYEFLPNTSLDKFLFDPNRRMQLDWETRFKIIVGIGRGILYLHEDSSLKIIHRDLKVSNILLDSNMNPKISDFGLAKLFGVDETERNTVKIAGTLEYMAPEYILHGLFSTKSDVFSYGVLLLEIITGEKKGTNGLEDAVDLLSYVWQQWRNRKALQVIDKSIGDRYPVQEAMRCIQIGLLCVQEEQIQRPNMASVTIMLSTSSMKLPTPSAPAFYVEPRKSVSVQESMARIRDIDLELPVMSSMISQDVWPGLGR